MPGLGISVRMLLRLAALSCSMGLLPLGAQQPSGTHGQKQLAVPPVTAGKTLEASLIPVVHDFRLDLMLGDTPGHDLSRPRSDSFTFEKPLWTSSPGAIQRMESSFYCNDTPFVDQVRLPLATFWRGRVKLVGFESDVTTANFVMGLPGQGALHNLSAFGGNGFLAVHTPPSDQLAGIHMTLSWHGSEVDSGESSALRGLEYLVRAGRGFLPLFGGRADSSALALP